MLHARLLQLKAVELTLRSDVLGAEAVTRDALAHCPMPESWPVISESTSGLQIEQCNCSWESALLLCFLLGEQSSSDCSSCKTTKQAEERGVRSEVGLGGPRNQQYLR